MTPWGVVNLEPWGLIGRIHVGDHYTLLHNSICKLWASWFRKEDFLSFSHYKSMGANEPPEQGQFGPKKLGRIYVVDHYTLLHTKYISSGPHGFREEDYFKFFPL